jgi:putative acetyltransferase
MVICGGLLHLTKGQAMSKIIRANSPELYEIGRRLFLEYQTYLGIDLCFQGFSKELETLSVMYGPPSGALLLAIDKGEYVGCIGLRDLGEGVGEMKRMYVRPSYQGKGIGRDLLDAFLHVATEYHYRKIRLDTVPRLARALKLYRNAGFVEITPYRHNPDPEAIFMELIM